MIDGFMSRIIDKRRIFLELWADPEDVQSFQLGEECFDGADVSGSWPHRMHARKVKAG
jgi:hypothetical protein